MSSRWRLHLNSLRSGLGRGAGAYSITRSVRSRDKPVHSISMHSASFVTSQKIGKSIAPVKRIGWWNALACRNTVLQCRPISVLLGKSHKLPLEEFIAGLQQLNPHTPAALRLRSVAAERDPSSGQCR